MSEATLTPRVQDWLTRLDAWSDQGTAKALLMKAVVTVAGPLVILAGIAMLVLPGPGLVVIAAGLALLALEYPWARDVLGLMGRTLARAKQAVLPRDASNARRALGAVMIAAVAVAGFLATTAITALVGAHTVL